MDKLPNCPKCNCEYTYEDANLFICPECFHEWKATDTAQNEEDTKVIKDANGNVLNDGDTVTVIKDLKLKGNTSIKRGTIVKNIKLIYEPSDGIHNIDCKIDGFGAMLLKSSIVKKV
ncbi:MAG: alkylphosphonate utilization protein [Clostridium sp.]|jgi:protein PhnA|nr:alkylphosphonate utilization protein [Clostridium sp.]